MLDILLKNAEIVDGSGEKSFFGNVAVKNGKIVKVGNVDAQAATTIDCTGKVLCPGFIDVHTHNDIMLLYDTACLSKLHQGVTTQIIGNCGFSAAPINDETHELLISYAEPSLGKWKNYDGWHSFGEYLERLKALPLAGNVGALVGSGTVRMAVKGFETSKMSNSELDKAKAYISEAFSSGALGFSLGLTYSPDNYYTTAEMIEINKKVAELGGVLSVHMRGEGDSLYRSIDEMIEIAKHSGVSVNISHFKSAGKNNWGKIGGAIEKIENAKAQGLDISCDFYPYEACFSQFPFLMPPWVAEGGIKAAVKRVLDKETRKKIIKEMSSRQESWDCLVYSTGWENVIIASTVNPSHKGFEGKSVAEIALLRNQNPYECGLDLFSENDGKLGFIFHFVSEQDIETILKWDNSYVASDSTYVNDGICHPRIFGTNIKILSKYVREKKIISLEKAVMKMTKFPAKRFGLKDKGEIAEGLDADLVLFDKDKVEDTADYQNPKSAPTGIELVLVNGAVAVEKGIYKFTKTGRVITK